MTTPTEKEPKKTNPEKPDPTKKPAKIEEDGCVKPHVAENYRLDDEDDSCNDSVS